MRTRAILGIVTIGQTPRPDLERAFRVHAPGASIVIRGALDGLAARDLDAIVDSDGPYPLLVRLADGGTREIALDSLHPRVAERARELAGLGARVVVVACAGDFPDVSCDVPVLLPGRILPAVVSAIVPAGRIGIVTPIRAQAEAALRKWAAAGFDPVVTWASPWAHEEIEQAAGRMLEPGIELVVLDCMGHGDDYALEFGRRTGKLVLAAQSLTARLAGEMLRT